MSREKNYSVTGLQKLYDAIMIILGQDLKRLVRLVGIEKPKNLSRFERVNKHLELDVYARVCLSIVLMFIS